MAYTSDKKPLELTELTTLASGDGFVVGDADDATEVAKYITKANLEADLNFLQNVVEDTTPQLGGTLDLNGNSISDSGAVAISISQAGAGALNVQAAAGGLNLLTTSGNGNITINPHGTGEIILTDITASRLLATGASSEITELDTATYPSLTEITYVKGVTSAIQTQLDTKAPTASPTFTGTVTLPTGLTGVIRADSGVVSVDSDVTDIVSAASDTAAGKVELATSAETSTGTDTGRAVTPDGLAGSVFGTKSVGIQVTDGSAAIATGDGKAYFRVPASMNGMNITTVGASLTAPSTSGNPTIMIARGRQSAPGTAHAFVDVLSTAITIDANEYDSKDATTAAVINGSNDDLATGDLIRVDVDGVGSGPTAVLSVNIEAQLP